MVNQSLHQDAENMHEINVWTFQTQREGAGMEARGMTIKIRTRTHPLRVLSLASQLELEGLLLGLKLSDSVCLFSNSSLMLPESLC